MTYINTVKFNWWITVNKVRLLFYWRYNPLWVCILQPSGGAIASSSTRFLNHTQRRATVGTTPLDEWSVLRRDLYLTTHNTHNRKAYMPPVGFEPMIAAGERPLGPATGTGHSKTFFFLLALQPPLGVVFYSPLAGFSLLAYEVSWSHTTTRHSR